VQRTRTPQQKGRTSKFVLRAKYRVGIVPYRVKYQAPRGPKGETASSAGSCGPNRAFDVGENSIVSTLIRWSQ
jgi:hypothetical protein